MNRYYFRFGANGAHRNCYHVEIAENQEKARGQMVKKFGTNWAFQYSEDEWEVSEKHYRLLNSMRKRSFPYREGLTQAEMFNLKEI